MSSATRRFFALAAALSIFGGGCGVDKSTDGVDAFVDAFVAEPDASVFRVESAPRAAGGVAGVRLLAINTCALRAHDAQAPLYARVGGRAHPLPLSFTGAEVMAQQRLALCAFLVQPVQLLVSVFRPSVDVAILRVEDAPLPPVAGGRWRVIVRLDNAAERANVVGACVFGGSDDAARSCLIRRPVPFDWFRWEPPQERSMTPNRLRLSYTVVKDVGDVEDDSTKMPMSHSSDKDWRFVKVAEAIELSQDDWDNTASTVRMPLGPRERPNVGLYTSSNVSCVPNAIHTVLLAYGASEKASDANATVTATYENSSFLRIRIELDRRRFAVESIRPIASPHWLQSVERRPTDNTTAVYAVALYPAIDAMPPTAAPRVFLALALRCRAVDRSAAAAVRVETVGEGGNSNETVGHPATVAVKFPNANSDTDYAIVPILKSVELINTAALSGQTVTSPLRVLAASEAGQLHDVTDASHCLSADAHVLKASPTCGGIYADGAERRGASRLAVHVQYGSLAATAWLRVWYPRWPLTVRVTDEVLNQLTNWLTTARTVAERGPRMRRRSSEKCASRFQQTEIRVLATFHAVDVQTGDSAFLGGDETSLLDVTRLMRHRVRSSNPEAVGVRWTAGGRLLAAGHRPGAARLRANCLALAALDCGGAAVIVTREPAQVVALNAAVVTDVRAMARAVGAPISRASFVVNVNVLTRSDFFHLFQHGTLIVRIRYSDGHEESLADIERADFALRVHLPDERAIHVRVAARQNRRRRRFLSHGELALVELVAARAISGASHVGVELRVAAQCGGASIISGSVPVRTTFAGDRDRDMIATIEQNNDFVKNQSSGGDSTADTSSPNGLSTALIVLIILIIVIAVTFNCCRPADMQSLLCAGLLSLAATTTYESASDDDDEANGTFLSKSGDALYCITRWCCRRDGNRTPAGPGGASGGGFPLVGSGGYDKLSKDGRLGSSPSELSADSGRDGSIQRRSFSDALSFGSADSDGQRGHAVSKNIYAKSSIDGGFSDVAVEVKTVDHSREVLVGRRRRRFAGGWPLSAGRKASAAEWVWLPSGVYFADGNGGVDSSRHKSNSIGSQYSRRSTLELSGRNSDSADSSNDGSPQGDVTVSYRGSEISVSIGRQSSNVTVNSETTHSDVPMPRTHRSYSALTANLDASVRLRPVPSAAATFKRRAEGYSSYSDKFEVSHDMSLVRDEQLIEQLENNPPLTTSNVNYDRWRFELPEHPSAGDLPRFFDYSLPLPSRLLDQLPCYRPTSPSDTEYGRRHRRRWRRSTPLSPPPATGIRRLTLAASSAAELDACLNGLNDGVVATHGASLVPPLPRWLSSAASGGWAAATAATVVASLSSSSSTLRETFA